MKWTVKSIIYTVVYYGTFNKIAGTLDLMMAFVLTNYHDEMQIYMYKCLHIAWMGGILYEYEDQLDENKNLKKLNDVFGLHQVRYGTLLCH